MSNTRVLLNWQPPVLDRSLGERFRGRMAASGFVCIGIVEVRDPGRNQYIEAPKRWHRDDPSSELLIIMWSNVRPTEVRFADGRLLEGTQDGDVILVDDNEVEHRAPEDQTDRWFIRAYVMDGKGEKS